MWETCSAGRRTTSSLQRTARSTSPSPARGPGGGCGTSSRPGRRPSCERRRAGRPGRPGGRDRDAAAGARCPDAARPARAMARRRPRLEPPAAGAPGGEWTIRLLVEDGRTVGWSWLQEEKGQLEHDVHPAYRHLLDQILDVPAARLALCLEDDPETRAAFD